MTLDVIDFSPAGLVAVQVYNPVLFKSPCTILKVVDRIITRPPLGIALSFLVHFKSGVGRPVKLHVISTVVLEIAVTVSPILTEIFFWLASTWVTTLFEMLIVGAMGSVKRVIVFYVKYLCLRTLVSSVKEQHRYKFTQRKSANNGKNVQTD